MEKEPAEKTSYSPFSKGGEGDFGSGAEKASEALSRREFLKAAGKAAAFGLGALVFGAERSEGAIPSEKTKSRVGSAKESKTEKTKIEEEPISEELSHKLAILERALSDPHQRKRFASAHRSIFALQVGQPHQDGVVVWFTREGEGPFYLGFEEWRRRDDGKFHVLSRWFTFVKTKGGYTRGHWTWHEGEVPEKFGDKIVYGADLDPNTKESADKLNQALEILIQEYDRPLPP